MLESTGVNVNRVFHFYPVSPSHTLSLLYFDQFCFQRKLPFTLFWPKGLVMSFRPVSDVEFFYFDNQAKDTGAFSDYMMSKDLHSGHFQIVNSSMVGPFFKESNKDVWPKTQLGLLEAGAGLAGDAINNLSRLRPHGIHYGLKYGFARNLRHVQTGAYSISETLLQHLQEIGFFNAQRASGKLARIRDYEIRMSVVAAELGFEIAGLELKSKNGKDPYDIDSSKAFEGTNLEFIKPARLPKGDVLAINKAEESNKDIWAKATELYERLM